MKSIFILFSFLVSTVLLQAKGTIQIKSNINDAFIYVDGKKKAMLGEEYAELYLDEGEYLIEIKKKSNDGAYIYKGAKMVFVGDNTKSKINIKTKKIYTQVKKKKVLTTLEKLDAISKKNKKLTTMMKRYYKSLNDGNYKVSYEMLSENYKKNISYKTFKQYWKNSIKKVKLLDKKYIYIRGNKNKYEYNLIVGYITANNQAVCNKERTTYIYTDDKWYLDRTIVNKCEIKSETTYSKNGKIKVETPHFYVKGQNVSVKVTMTPKYNLSKGGITVNFMGLRNINIQDYKSTFDSTKHYKSKSKMWNKELKKSIPIKNDVYEGWTNNWGKEKTKVLYFTIKPKKYSGSILMGVRGIQIDKNKNEYPIPIEGIQKDEQGYNNNFIYIPILN